MSRSPVSLFRAAGWLSGFDHLGVDEFVYRLLHSGSAEPCFLDELRRGGACSAKEDFSDSVGSRDVLLRRRHSSSAENHCEGGAVWDCTRPPRHTPPKGSSHRCLRGALEPVGGVSSAMLRVSARSRRGNERGLPRVSLTASLSPCPEYSG